MRLDLKIACAVVLCAPVAACGGDDEEPKATVDVTIDGREIQCEEGDVDEVSGGFCRSSVENCSDDHSYFIACQSEGAGQVRCYCESEYGDTLREQDLGLFEGSQCADSATVFAECSRTTSGDGDGALAGPWDSEPDGVVEASGSMTVTVNGEPRVGTIYNAQYTPRFGQFDLDALGDDLFLGVTLNAELAGVGVFDCGDPNEATLGGNFDSFGAFSDNTSGCVVNITEFGDVGEPIVGTFSGTVVDSSGVVTTLENGTIDAIRGTTTTP